jgi:hypothetical protein
MKISNRQKFALILTALFISITFTLLFVRPAVSVQLLRYEQISEQKYAVLILSNKSSKSYSFATCYCDSEILPRHFISVWTEPSTDIHSRAWASLRTGPHWSQVFEPKYLSFAPASSLEIIQPHSSTITKVPVDGALRKVAIPISRSPPVNRLHKLFQILAANLRTFFGMKPKIFDLVWCPTTLQWPENQLSGKVMP